MKIREVKKNEEAGEAVKEENEIEQISEVIWIYGKRRNVVKFIVKEVVMRKEEGTLYFSDLCIKGCSFPHKFEVGIKDRKTLLLHKSFKCASSQQTVRSTI